MLKIYYFDQFLNDFMFYFPYFNGLCHVLSLKIKFLLEFSKVYYRSPERCGTNTTFYFQSLFKIKNKIANKKRNNIINTLKY